MNTFILHHYEFSPYSEKVRRMLAYAELDWQSVIHKEMPPRPMLQELAGNYERIPVGQVGADIFCDSNMMAEEIALLANKPELSLVKSSQEIKDFIAHVEGKIFFAGVLSGGSAKLRNKIRQQMSLWDLGRFFVDRLKMGFTATTDNMIKITQAKNIITEHLKDMEVRLDQDFLFGNTPSLADFSAYHSLWFIRDAGEKSFINNYPKVCAWMDRVKNLGQEKRKDLEPQVALDIAKAATPRTYDFPDAGKTLSIGPSDYRQKATAGKLVYEDEQRWVLSQSNDKTGDIQIHFPKLAYKPRLQK